MTLQQPHSSSDRNRNAFPAELPPAALLRAGADGELDAGSTPGQTAALERLLTDPRAAAQAGVSGAEARVEFERALRPACDRCMCAGVPAVSASLRERVEAAMVDSGGRSAVVGHGARDSVAAGVPRGRAPASRARRAAMSLGATAILAFAGIAVYQAIVNTGTIANPQAGFTAQLASFVTTEHERTAVDSEEARTKFGCTDFSRVCPDLSPRLGASPELPPLGGAHDLAFQGAGPCGVPGGASIHVRFYTRHDVDGHQHEISLFVQRDSGRLDLDEGRVYSLECPKGDVCVWRRGTLVYFLVSDDPHGCACFREAAGIGDPTGTVRAR